MHTSPTAHPVISAALEADQESQKLGMGPLQPEIDDIAPVTDIDEGREDRDYFRTDRELLMDEVGMSAKDFF